MDESLIEQFDEEMLRIYRRAQAEAHYNATLFLQMLHEHRGLETARILIHKEKVWDGYTALYLRGRLDLTVEAVIYDNPKWHLLFTPEELQICAHSSWKISLKRGSATESTKTMTPTAPFLLPETEAIWK